MAVLELENVTKAYDHKPALRGVELKVDTTGETQGAQ